MTPPHRILFKGESGDCYKRLGFARRVMFVLESMMEIRKLDQHTARVLTGDGALVTCSKVFGKKTTIIAVGEQYIPPPPAAYKCFCGCNYTEGWILQVQDEPLEGDGGTLYTVMACYNETRYIMVKDVLASDFTTYEAGWKVLLVPYNAMAYLCCDVPVDATGCKPVKTTEAIASDDWRTTLRIVPWCALRVPKWRKK